MKQRLTSLIFCLIAFYLPICQAETQSDPMLTTSPLTQAMQQEMTTTQALDRLKAGNARFVANQLIHRDLENEIITAQTGQHPFAVILNCMDSRSIPELTFDQGIGDVFALRIAGNVLNKDILGSMEFGTAAMGAHLIVVMGHTACGAMKGACEGVKLGHLTDVLAKIQPAVKEAMQQTQSKDCNSASLADAIAKDNVLLVVQEIKQESPILDKLIAEKKLAIVGAMYDVATGKVEFVS